ncbi:unnamed protein product [Trichobilharzia regenti]|uniref:Serine/threonine-protein kinase n=1 Tax=Trichobilharzia regenti TaxID=157069 RepID=A0A183WHG1_TRIRE|nr:unnamed protein product [Trichobilharzia regenti]VDQ07444.1 unnamed protein product [Trichobilharzia regenti]
MESICEKSSSSGVSNDSHKLLMKCNYPSTLTLSSSKPDKLTQKLVDCRASSEMIPNLSNGLGDSEHCLSLPNITRNKALNNSDLYKQKDAELLSTEYKLHRANYLSLQPRNHNNYYLSISRIREEKVFKYFLSDHENKMMKPDRISFINSKKHNKDILCPLTTGEPTLFITNSQGLNRLTNFVTNDNDCQVNKNFSLNKLTEKQSSKATTSNYDYSNIEDNKKYQTDILSWSDVLQYCNEEDLGGNTAHFGNEYCDKMNLLNNQSSLDEIETLNRETSKTNFSDIRLTKKDFPDLLFSDIKISDLFGDDNIGDNDDYSEVMVGDNRKKKIFLNSSTMTEDLTSVDDDELHLKHDSEKCESKPNDNETNAVDEGSTNNHEEDNTSSSVPLKHKCFKIFPCIARNDDK